MITSRLKAASRAAGVHFVCSLAVGLSAAAVIFNIWFPYPYDQMAGGQALFWILVSVDVVSGPLLTLVVFNPLKPRRERVTDLTAIAGLQLLALGYGLHTLSLARPIALVYEIDRFRVISMVDIPEEYIPKLPEWVDVWGWQSPKVVGLSTLTKGNEVIESMELSFQGIEPSQRPLRWQDYALNHNQVLSRAKPISALKDMHPESMKLINSFLQKINHTDTTVLWLPVTGRLATDWVVLIEKSTASQLGFLHLNGL